MTFCFMCIMLHTIYFPIFSFVSFVLNPWRATSTNLTHHIKIDKRILKMSKSPAVFQKAQTGNVFLTPYISSPHRITVPDNASLIISTLHLIALVSSSPPCLSSLLPCLLSPSITGQTPATSVIGELIWVLRTSHEGPSKPCIEFHWPGLCLSWKYNRNHKGKEQRR